MDLLVAAPTMDERRSAFDALRHMTEGTEQLVHALDHREWFVVRNVEAPLGELGIEDAVPAVARRPAPEARGTLDGLADDGDKQVRAAARAAVSELGRKRRG